MPTVNDIPISLRPLWVIDRRLAFHTQPGQMLDGLKFYREGNKEATGKQDLPYVQWYALEDEEDWSDGGAGHPFKNVRTLVFEVAVFRAYGMFRRGFDTIEGDSDVSGGGMGVLEWVDLVRDAIETDIDGTTDPYLEGSQQRPILSSIVDQTPSDLAWSFLLAITVTIDFVCHGKRSVLDHA